jgi:hypothetical protein
MKCVSALLVLAIPGFPDPGDIIPLIDRAQLARDEQLLSYTVTEHYTLKNARFGTSADMVANVTYTKGAGKVYEVVSRSGSAMMQSKVFDRVLAEEAEMSHGATRRAALITSANYLMKPRGEQEWNGRRALLLDITPRRKDRNLLRGRLWVDAVNYNVIRIEGTLVVSPSFFVGSTTLYREYADIGNFAFAQNSVATSGSLLLGKTEMTIEYTGYQIHAENQQPAPAAAP